jgi:hypothetical protein
MFPSSLKMYSLLALALASLSSVPSAQDGAASASGDQRTAAQQPTRKQGTIFKNEVDRLVNAIAGHTATPGSAAPYTPQAQTSAQLLTALGHCHRFYTAIDHPRIRSTVQQLMLARQSDGSFGDAETTAWTIDALSCMDGSRYRDEIETARRWLQREGSKPQTFDAMVQKVLQARSSPQVVGADAAHASRKMADSQPLDPAAATQTVLLLVACQTANRILDRGDGPKPAEFGQAQQRAVDFLMAKQKDGIFMAVFNGQAFPDPAITGFSMLALQTKPRSLRSAVEQTAIDQGLEWLMSSQNEDGSFGQQVQNYTTSVVIGALKRWGRPETVPVLARAQKYILMCQNAEQSGYQPADRDYGGMGYGSGSNLRADMSNLNFALQALRETGLDPEHEAFAKALVFMQRTQNLKSINDFQGRVTNPDKQGELMDITSGDDGGAAYYPGNSAAGYIVQPDGKSQPRSYGSMTYALLKSYTLCGVGLEDERVAAAVRWIQANWNLAINPGFDPSMGEKARYQGLFYYYMVLAQSLDMAGVARVRVDVDGKPVELDWRQALRRHLEGMQDADGSWTNKESSRWMEGYDVLCTCYSLVALERCR